MPENATAFSGIFTPRGKRNRECLALSAMAMGFVSSSAQAMDHSLPAKAESSFPMLCLLPPQNPMDFAGPPESPRVRERKIIMLEYLICSTRPVRLPALPAVRQGRKSFHLFVRLYAGGGLMDAGRVSAPCPRARVRRGGVPPTRFSAGTAAILLNNYSDRDSLILYCFPETENRVIPRL